MERKRYAQLLRVEHDRPVTKETDGIFLHELKCALLLALKERGLLNEMQYRQALEKCR